MIRDYASLVCLTFPIAFAFALQEDKEKPKFDEKNLIGVWKATNGPDVEHGFEVRLEFLKDKTVKFTEVHKGKIHTDKATWKLSGETLTITAKETIRSSKKNSEPIEREITVHIKIKELTETKLRGISDKENKDEKREEVFEKVKEEKNSK